MLYMIRIKIILVVLIGVYSGLTYADNDTLDSTFGVDGIVTISLGGMFSGTSGILDSQNRIIMAGQNLPPGPLNSLFIARCNADGTLDTTFAGTGSLIVSPTTFGASAFDIPVTVAVQRDDTIIVGATVTISGNDQICIFKLTTTGVLDVTFGTGGFVTALVGDVSRCSAIAVQADNKIIVAGTSTLDAPANDSLILRYQSNGSLDLTFNGTGIVLVPPPPGGEGITVSGVGLDADNSIVAVGAYQVGMSTFIVFFRVTTTGLFDTSFGSAGYTTRMTSDQPNTANTVTFDSNKNILSGYTIANTTSASILRLTSDGSFDTTFHGNGEHQVSLSLGMFQQGIGNSVVVQPDNKPIFVSALVNIPPYNTVLMRMTTTGELDTTFNGSGIVIKNYGASNSIAWFALMQPNGKLVTFGGAADDPTSTDIAAEMLRFSGSNTCPGNLVLKKLFCFGIDGNLILGARNGVRVLIQEVGGQLQESPIYTANVDIDSGIVGLTLEEFRQLSATECPC
jgi:uncharacterized delta-60 repeat protein